MRTPAKVLVGLAFAGAALAAGSAATGAGVTNSAPSSQFIGGTVSQTVVGATLDTIHYTTDTVGSAYGVTGVTLTFHDDHSDGATVALTATSDDGGSGTFTCGNVVASTNVSTCTIATGTVITGLSGITVTVS